ncbi:hypothetical protein FQN57_005237 [Myotisia sp. PD_48]|nr:hypothetical protein FQN57_005237 [Myotisia sp. PD_48]
MTPHEELPPPGTTDVSQPSEPIEETPGAFPESPHSELESGVSSDLSSLSRAVRARKAAYIRQRRFRVRVGSWNVAALPGSTDDIRKWFAGGTVANISSSDLSAEDVDILQNLGSDTPDLFEAYDQGPDICVLGLQEVIDISSPAETLKPFFDQAPAQKWKDIVQSALSSYKFVSSQQLMGLLLLIYAAPSMADHISSVNSTSVGTGLMGYMGNKGATATRIVVGETTRLVFINCHMAAGADRASLDRRNWDAAQIKTRLKFDPIDNLDLVPRDGDQSLGKEEFCFWFGDLNYRLDDIPGDDVRHLLHLHTENQWNSTKRKHLVDDDANSIPDGKSQVSLESQDSETSEEYITLEDNDIEPVMDPASLQSTLASLLPHDQLQIQQKGNKAFHEGWCEGPVEFLPTYKYDIGLIGKFDSSEKQRSPSWCDRILFRTRNDYLSYEQRVKEQEESKKRDEEMKGLGLEEAAEDDNVLFDYDPELDAAEYDPDEDDGDGEAPSPNRDGQTQDSLILISYESHQNIVASDHKPIHADFLLTLDAVIPALKTVVHQEVVRELDRAENEARPDITVVLDQQAEARPGRPVTEGQPDTIDFGPVRYGVPHSRNLTLANTGSVPATFSFHCPSFSDSGDSTSSSPPWLRIGVDWPFVNNSKDGAGVNEYTLQLGDSTNVKLTLCVDDIDFVRKLNTGKSKIEEIMILRVTNGRDHFISIRGSWLPTSFGFSLEELTCMPEQGARALDITNHEIDVAGNRESARFSGPRELFKLTEAIAEYAERAVAEWDMISTGDDKDETCPWGQNKCGWPFDTETWAEDHPGRQHLFACVREALDTNTPFNEHLPPELSWRHHTELLAGSLLSFLRSLKGGIICENIWKQLQEVQNPLRENPKQPTSITSIEQAQSQILEILSLFPARSVSFTFLTFMITRIAQEIAPIGPSADRQPEVSTPTSPPFPISAAKSALAFPFRFKSRNRTSSDGNWNDTQPTIPHSNVDSTRREVVNKAYATIFAKVIFSSSIPVPEKEKERRAWEERKKSILELFLNGNVG